MTADRDSQAALVASAREGDAAAFERLVRANIDAVYGHALRFFGDPASAEDAVQEVFIKVYRSLDTFDGRSAFSTWLFRITRNVCLDMFRAGRRRPVPIDPVDAVPIPAPGDMSELVVTRAAVESAMAALAPEDRDALSAIALFDLSYEDAATALGVPVGTVKSRVFRARKTLVAVLGVGGGGA